ncbi:MAG: Ig-like domain-containing protein [Gemmatimonadota bacterium]
MTHRAWRPLAAALGVTVVVGAACDDDDPAGPDLPGEPSSMTLSADTVHLAALGAAYPLHATVADANGVVLPDAAVSWSSADEDVAAVDGSGRVEAVAEGETEITAEAGGASDAATVIVTQTAAFVEVEPTLGELSAIGDSVRFAAVVRDANGRAIADAAVLWSSADTTVAAVDEAGWVAARANGTAAIEAAVGDVSGRALARVEQVVASVTVGPAADTLGQHDVMNVTAEAVDANGEAVPGATVAWSSSDPTAATVDADGRVTAVGWGADVTVTATVDGVSGEAELHVLDQLAMVTTRDGGFDIYVINLDGSGQRNLTAHPGGDHGPAWSPDGMKLAFSSPREDFTDPHIWVMNADGTAPKNVSYAGSASADGMPAWSPDGSKIAFASDRDDGDRDIYTMNANGTGVDRLTTSTADDRWPAWSPDGSQIAFVSDRDDGVDDIYVLGLDGSGPTPLTSSPADDNRPAWSPDGERIAFTTFRDGNWEIYVMDADGSNQTNLTNDGSTDAGATWSPDGSRIAFRRHHPGNFELYVMDADGSNQTRITETSENEEQAAWRPRP